MFFYSGGSSWGLLGFLIWSIFEIVAFAPLAFLISYTMVLWGIGVDFLTACSWAVNLTIATMILFVLFLLYIFFIDNGDEEDSH